MARLRVGIIGLGNAVEPHAKSLIDLRDRVEVVAAASRSTERCEIFARRFGLPTTTDLDGVIADTSIDALWILTPPNVHLELAGRAAEAGKHVLLEKPLDISLERARAIVAAMRQAGRTLGVTLQHRFRPATLRLREVVRSGPTTTSRDAAPWRATGAAC
jgi:UDP-N-acetyl-2-amino-2-deoxyglucuronate dehydrogenase